MQTAFTQEQLTRPEIAEADGILRTCVHYGFCTATCPTYVLFRDENDSPRGRIDLIRAMLEKGGPPEPKTVHHLDRCLSCLSCVTTCAVKVDYAHLIDIARAYIEKNYRRPFGERMLRTMLAKTLPYPRRFAAAMRLARLAQPFRRMMPKRLANLVRLAEREARTSFLPPQVIAAQGERKMRVILLAGCAQQALDSDINDATIRVLTRHGCEVVIAQGAGCCGALPLHMGREEEGRALARRTAAAFAGIRDVDAVVINASGCGTTVKDYAHLLGDENGRRVGAMTRDITEFLDGLDLKVTNGKYYRVAYHDACSLQHGQRVTAPPRALLDKCGFEVVDLPEKHFCCGSAGTYNLLQPDIAQTLGQRKAGHAESLDPDFIAAGNLGCMVQIGRYTALPVLHTVSLIDWGTGGPLPLALRGRVLRETRPKLNAIEGTAGAGSPTNDSGFW